MEEAVVRLVAREAMAALEREREEEAAATGGSEGEVPPSLTGSALSWRLDSAIRVVVSNANLGAVSIRVGRDGTGRGGAGRGEAGRGGTGRHDAGRGRTWRRGAARGGAGWKRANGAMFFFHVFQKVTAT